MWRAKTRNPQKTSKCRTKSKDHKKSETRNYHLIEHEKMKNIYQQSDWLHILVSSEKIRHPNVVMYCFFSFFYVWSIFILFVFEFMSNEVRNLHRVGLEERKKNWKNMLNQHEIVHSMIRYRTKIVLLLKDVRKFTFKKS